jgi:hypothetical protein
MKKMLIIFITLVSISFICLFISLLFSPTPWKFLIIASLIEVLILVTLVTSLFKPVLIFTKYRFVDMAILILFTVLFLPSVISFAKDRFGLLTETKIANLEMEYKSTGRPFLIQTTDVIDIDTGKTLSFFGRDKNVCIPSPYDAQGEVLGQFTITYMPHSGYIIKACPEGN